MINLPLRFKVKSGEIKPMLLDCSAKRSATGEIIFTRSYLRDNTVQLLRKEILKIKRKRERSLRITQNKDHFLRRFFHEIKTPLHVLTNTLDSMHIGDTTLEHDIDVLQKQTNGIVMTMNDLTFSTLWSGKSRPGGISSNQQVFLPVVIAQLFKDVCDAEQRSGQEVVMHFNVQLSCCVAWAPTSLNRVIYHLVRNAVRFSPSKSEISIKLTQELSRDSPRKISRHEADVDGEENLQGDSCGSSDGVKQQLRIEVSNNVDRNIDPEAIQKLFHNKFSLGMDDEDEDEELDDDGYYNEDAFMNATSGSSGTEGDSETRSRAFSNGHLANQGLGTGLFIIYNILKNLNGSFSCRAAPGRAIFVAEVPLNFDAKEGLMKEFSLTNEERKILDASGCFRYESIIMDEVPTLAMVLKSSQELLDSQMIDHAAVTQSNSPEQQNSSLIIEAPRLDRPQTILVVDDSIACQKVLVRMLSQHGYHTVVANNGKEACDKVRELAASIRIVLMDLRMPVMDGIEATIYIRQTLHFSQPIFVISAELNDIVIADCKRAGADHCICKPTRTEDVLNPINFYLANV